jgi:hypothetical protein
MANRSDGNGNRSYDSDGDDGGLAVIVVTDVEVTMREVTGDPIVMTAAPAVAIRATKSIMRWRCRARRTENAPDELRLEGRSDGLEIRRYRAVFDE